MLHPKAACAKCKREFPVEELELLPEVDAYQRAFAMSLKNGTPPPALFDEKTLSKKYGYGSRDLFCRNCLGQLIVQTK